MIERPLLLLALLLAAPDARALDLAFPAPTRETATTTETGAAYNLPVGPWDGETFASRRVEGTVERRAYRIEEPIPTISLLAALREQVQAAGWRVLYECDAPVCGGFDFRFATTIIPEPEMHVDLGDFRVLSADKGAAVLNLIVSRSPRASFVQVTIAQPGAAPAPQPPMANAAPEVLPQPEPLPPPVPGIPDPTPSLPTTDPPQSPIARLLSEGHAVLPDLRFASGASELVPGDYPSLTLLADWLKANPDRRIALVGHTDASGSLEPNIALSRRRAAAIRAELINTYGVAPAQLEAEGVGYLSPLAPNLTEEGREANRRVEAVLLPLAE